MVQSWINSDGSSTPIWNPQDVAEALDGDPETADALGEEIAQDLEDNI